MRPGMARGMIPLAVPNLAGNEARYLQECIDTTFVSSAGPFVGRFERMVADAVGSSHAVATSSGTTGLHLALTAVGVGRDDVVIMPSLTFVATANAAAQCGAVPWLFDVDAETWTLDTKQLAAALSRDAVRSEGGAIHRPTGRRIGAIMPVHTLGTTAGMDDIVAAALALSIPIVADGAAALGATYRGRRPGEVGAHLTVYSFNGNKTVTAGGGGIVAGSDPDLLRLARHLSSTGRVGEDYDHDRPAFNYRMTNLQAAVGCAQMELLDRFVAAKRGLRGAYDRAASGLPGVMPFPLPAEGESACWFSGVVIDRDRADRVPDIRRRLREAGIDARPFWKPMHLQPPYANCPREPLPITDDLWRRILPLPCSTNLTDADLATVVAELAKALDP